MDACSISFLLSISHSLSLSLFLCVCVFACGSLMSNHFYFAIWMTGYVSECECAKLSCVSKGLWTKTKELLPMYRVTIAREEKWPLKKELTQMLHLATSVFLETKRPRTNKKHRDGIVESDDRK